MRRSSSSLISLLPLTRSLVFVSSCLPPYLPHSLPLVSLVSSGFLSFSPHFSFYLGIWRKSSKTSARFLPHLRKGGRPFPLISEKFSPLGSIPYPPPCLIPWSPTTQAIRHIPVAALPQALPNLRPGGLCARNSLYLLRARLQQPPSIVLLPGQISTKHIFALVF